MEGRSKYFPTERPTLWACSACQEADHGAPASHGEEGFRVWGLGLQGLGFRVRV